MDDYSISETYEHAKMLSENLEGKHNSGKRRHRWEDNMKIYLKES
jgi:hypothetical protein